MLGARLFVIGAVAITLIAFVPIKLSDARASLDFYMHGTYFVVVPRHMGLGLALLFCVIAGLYYFGDRALGLRLTNALSLAHFLLWIFSPVVFIFATRVVGRTISAGQDPTQSSALRVGLVAPVLAFIVGAALFLVNLAHAIVLKFKTS